jgi:hypothetical protein
MHSIMQDYLIVVVLLLVAGARISVAAVCEIPATTVRAGGSSTLCTVNSKIVRDAVAEYTISSTNPSTTYELRMYTSDTI